MSMIQSDLLLGQEGGAGYTISRSLRFNSSDSAFLSRTPASAGNRKTWTWAGWVKRCKTGQAFRLLGQDSYPNYTICGFTGSDKLYCITVTGDGSTVYMRQSIAVYRDTSAWYHVTIVHDTTDATTSNRYRLYVNGSLVATELGEGSYDYPPQNTNGYVNATLLHHINYFPVIGASSPGDSYLADVFFIDGQALDPSSFVVTSATTGRLEPKKYAGTFGTNGFWLPFSDTSSTTSGSNAGIGKDFSGNGNYWNSNNLSVTAGSGLDLLVDTPSSAGTDTGVGGVVTGNYATLNPLARGANSSQITLSNGNLDALWSSAVGYAVAVATIGVSSGKWYWEVTHTQSGTRTMIGVVQASADLASYIGTTGPAYDSAGYTWRNDVNTAATSYGVNDIVGIALDLDNGKIWFAKNGTWLGSGNPAGNSNPVYSSLSGTFFPAISEGDGNSPIGVTCNFGQRPFAYTAPSGYKALCTQNLPDPTITNPSTVMDVKLDTGSNILATAQGALSGSADLLWIKDRANANNHQLIDTVRGGTATLQSNTTAAETTYSAPSGNSVAWCWDAGSSTVTNTAGTIQSSVRANASAGFSVVTWNYNGTNATVGHGLGVAPGMIIAKRRDDVSNWFIYHSGIGPNAYMYLNSTGAQITNITGVFDGNSSTVFEVNNSLFPGATATYVAYCFAPVAGYSSFGSYTGNGSADGPFVWCGFRPRWVLIKSSTAATAWTLQDTSRSPYNLVDARLFPNTSEAEFSNGNGGCDYLSNGFKIRVSHTELNTSGATFIYAAFAENPFQYARAR